MQSPVLPSIPVRILNSIGKNLRIQKIPFLKFSETALCQTAEKLTGLSDFGDSYFREGLNHLVDSAENEAGLHFYGRLALHRWIITHLSNRLRLMEFQKKKPEILQK